MARRITRTLIATIGALLIAGCAEMKYNPYVSNNSHRPLAKTVEAVPDAAGNALDRLDARIENILY